LKVLRVLAKAWGISTSGVYCSCAILQPLAFTPGYGSFQSACGR
jgi:hypothetical protein